MAERNDNLSGFNLSHNLDQMKHMPGQSIMNALFGKPEGPVPLPSGEWFHKLAQEQKQRKCMEPHCDCSAAFHCADYVEPEPERIAPWIGVDLDGTLAEYSGYKGPTHIGAPIEKMVQRVKTLLEQGKNVKIFTARAYADDSPKRRRESVAAIVAIREWCRLHIGVELPVTCVKDFGMTELWDDRAIQVRVNTGERADGLS